MNRAEVSSFAEAARAFCELVEADAPATAASRLSDARRLLARLYAAACDLEPGPNGLDLDPPPRARLKTWSGLEPVEYYYENFDPLEPTEVGAGSLTDDFLDIHLDLKRGLSPFDAGHEAAAVWEWRTSFDEHWGRHAVSALRALHRACS